MAKPKRPTWFKVFDYQYPFILAMPDAAVGKAFRAGLAYFRSRELPEGLDPMETAIFNLFRDNADEALEDFERSVENGKKGSLAKKEGKTPSAPLREADADTDADAETDTDTKKKTVVMGAKPRTQRFKPPTEEDVRSYCKEKGYDLDPQLFLDYYTANGWRVGRNPMKDWKAALRTWNTKEVKNGKTGLRNEPKTTVCRIGTVL